MELSRRAYLSRAILPKLRGGADERRKVTQRGVAHDGGMQWYSYLSISIYLHSYGPSSFSIHAVSSECSKSAVHVSRAGYHLASLGFHAHECIWWRIEGFSKSSHLTVNAKSKLQETSFLV